MADPPESKPASKNARIDPFNLQVGEEVRRRRVAADLSLSDLAGRTGIARTFLWRAETGRQGMTVKSLAQVSKALGCTPSELLAGIESIMPTIGDSRSDPDQDDPASR